MLASSLLVLALSGAAPNVHPLRYHLVGDSVATGVGSAAWLSSEYVFKDQLAPKCCRWCDRTGLQDTLNPIDRWGRGLAAGPDSLKGWDTASTVVGFVVLPLTLFGTDAWLAHGDDALNGVPVDILLSVEALMGALTINQAVKFVAGRERPYVHRRSLGQVGPSSAFANPTDDNLSFFSGHSTFSFALLSATATIADLRGYRGAKWVWIVGLPIATAVPLMRMAADKHYLTDVATGALVGTLVGIGVPRLFHGRADSGLDVTLVPAPGGIAVDARF